jgi:transcriptional regulator with XRE-family HTH domain
MTDDLRTSTAIRIATDLACPHHRSIAEEVGVTPLTLSHWRNGRRNPTTRNLMQLGRVLLEHGRALEAAAMDLMRLARQEELRDSERPATPIDTATLELFRNEREAV